MPLTPDAWRARIAAARDLAAPCALCEIRCGVDRLADQRGRCGLARDTPIYSRMLHFGEEATLIPSYILNFSGCSMHCTFCSEDAHLRPPFRGEVWQPLQLAQTLARELPELRPAPRNLNCVGGEPSISLPFLLELAEHLADLYPQHPPWLLNTNGYLTPEALALTEDVFDIFVVDFKFGPGPCAYTIGKVERYFDTLTDRLLRIARMPHQPRIIVRHLLMPGHLDCCTRPVLAWIAEHMPHVEVNLMPGFHPFSGTRATRFWSALGDEERDAALALLRKTPLDAPLWDGAPLP